MWYRTQSNQVDQLTYSPRTHRIGCSSSEKRSWARERRLKGSRVGGSPEYKTIADCVVRVGLITLDNMNNSNKSFLVWTLKTISHPVLCTLASRSQGPAGVLDTATTSSNLRRSHQNL